MKLVAPSAVIDPIEDLALLDAALEEVAAGGGVYALHPAIGDPLIGRTAVLRRRLKRLLRPATGPSKSLNLRSVVRRIEYWRTASWLESSLILYTLARLYFGDQWSHFIKLPTPSYVKLVISNPFPRTHVTTKLTGGSGLFYGPFRSRALAEEFEHKVLDLFQIRRCQEDLAPNPGHPGCIYGEMNMCLRPCQEVVGVSEYASEVVRVTDFLRTSGKHMVLATETARDRLSEELDFEGAAREHKQLERIQEAIRMRDDLAGDVTDMNGIAVVPSTEQGEVKLAVMLAGDWQPVRAFQAATHSGEPVSLDSRLRTALSEVRESATGGREYGERQEHIALLVRWYFSSWRDGEWVPMPDLEKPPVRKLVGAISRTAAKAVQKT